MSALFEKSLWCKPAASAPIVCRPCLKEAASAVDASIQRLTAAVADHDAKCSRAQHQLLEGRAGFAELHLSRYVGRHSSRRLRSHCLTPCRCSDELAARVPVVEMRCVAETERLALKASLDGMDNLFVRRDSLISRLAVAVNEVLHRCGMGDDE